MLRCRELERGDVRQRRDGAAGREALLAGTAIHLLPGDVLCAAAEDRTALDLMPPPAGRRKSAKASQAAESVAGPREGALSAAAGIARGLQAAGTDKLVLAYAQAGAAEPGWTAALEWAQALRLPLVVGCADATGGFGRPGGRRDGKLRWAAMSRVAGRLRLPVLTVDGEDAVAVYRAMQESVIRARMGGGPVMIWAVLRATAGTGSRQPLGLLERYMAAHGIKPAL